MKSIASGCSGCKAYNPLEIGILGRDGVMLATHNEVDEVEEFGGCVKKLSRYHNAPLIKQMFYFKEADYSTKVLRRRRIKAIWYRISSI